MRKSILIIIIILFAANKNTNAQQDIIWTLEKCTDHALTRNITIRESQLTNERTVDQFVRLFGWGIFI